MPEFIAVQCFQCKHYQVCQKRKDGKFNCKLCGSKQSVRKIVARSNKAADVRKFVQNINLTRGQAEEQFDELHGADGVNRHAEEEAVYDENAGGAENRAALGYSLQSPYANDDIGRQKHVAYPKPSQSRSKWAPYDSVLSQNQATQQDGGTQEVEDGCQWDGDAVEEDFVTDLPESSSRRSGKRKRRVRREGTSLTASKRRTPSNPINADEGHRERDMVRSKDAGTRWEPQGHAQYSSSTKVPARRDSHARQGRWSKWNDAASTSHTEPRRDEFGDGTFTSMGPDEVVEEDIAY